jgi:hypothetical protein
MHACFLRDIRDTRTAAGADRDYTGQTKIFG